MAKCPTCGSREVVEDWIYKARCIGCGEVGLADEDGDTREQMSKNMRDTYEMFSASDREMKHGFGPFAG